MLSFSKVTVIVGWLCRRIRGNVMKRMISVILAALLVLACFGGCASEDTATSSSKDTATSSSKKPGSSTVAGVSGDASSSKNDTSSSQSEDASSDASSAEQSSGAVSGTESSRPSSAPSSTASIKYFDVDAEVRRQGKTVSDDVSACFKKDVEGYIINGGTYKVDAETLVRLTKTPVKGTGSVKWRSYNKLGTTTGNTDLFDGIVPVSKLHDPIFMSTALPSEITTHMDFRVNATNMAPAEQKWRKLLAIGAIYKEKDTVLPDDAEITICLGRVVLLGRTEEKGWFIANDMAHPAAPKHIYYLPWDLEHTLGTGTIPSDRIKTYSDHVEIKLTGAMLNGHFYSAGKENAYNNNKDKIEGSVLHFWGTNWTFADGSKVQGCVVGIQAWIKEPEYVGKVALAIGADWRPANNQALQCFSGMNYKLTTEPRLAIGHNVGPKAYDTIMDTDKVQQLLGMK